MRDKSKRFLVVASGDTFGVDEVDSFDTFCEAEGVRMQILGQQMKYPVWADGKVVGYDEAGLINAAFIIDRGASHNG